MYALIEERFLSKRHLEIMGSVEAISVTTFNCKGFKFRNFSFIKKIFDECSILLLQEHWLFNFEFKEFDKVLGDCGFHAKSSMKDDEMLRGRCYGGTAIIWHKSIKFSMTPINTVSDRICVVKCIANNREFLIFSVYMPENVRGNDTEFEDILYEIVLICNENENCDLIIGGDFNCDFIREDVRGRVLQGWMGLLEIKCPALLHDIRKPTFHGPDGRSSVLDYIFLNERIFNDMIFWDVHDRGDNLSDHSPKKITLSCNIEKLPTAGSELSSSTSYSQWKKASREHIENYQESLDALLSQIDLPLDAITCSNFSHCQVHYPDFIKLLHSVMDACERASQQCIPAAMPNGERDRNRNIPGWNEFVRDKRETSLFWHEIWKESGRPREGWIAMI